MLLTTLGLTAATAQLRGATLRYSAIPGAYPLPYGFDFSASTMRPYECARAGRLCATFQSSDDHRGTAGMERKRSSYRVPPTTSSSGSSLRAEWVGDSSEPRADLSALGGMFQH